jgi:hypothetical protein
MSAPVTKRQALPWPWWRRLWREFVWALDLDDGNGDGSPSLTKWLALVFGVLAVAAVWFGKAVTATHLTLAIIAISAAFGRGIWRAYLQRTTVSLASTESTSTSVTKQLVEQVQARRDPDAGYEISK